MILPDEVFTQLAYMLQEGDKLQWDVGDYINELWEQVLGTIPKGEVRAAHADLILTLAEGTGANKSTLNDRQNMANFFPQPMRDLYHMLTYSQMRACKRAGPDDWETWADWSLVNGAEGRPASVKHIRAAIGKEKNPEAYWRSKLERIRLDCLKILSDSTIPERVRDSVELILGITQDAITN